MPAALDERVETPTHRSRRRHQRTGADERKRSVPTGHFIAFIGAAAAFIALEKGFTVFFFMAFRGAAAAFIGFAMTRGGMRDRGLH